MKKLPQISSRTGYIPFAGGLDTETPPISTTPGTLLDSVNVYQGVNGGYVTMFGYETFTGQPSPADALYYILEVIGLDGVSVGDVVTAGEATATVIAIEGETLVLARLNGVVTPGELLVNGVAVGSFVTNPVENGAVTEELDRQYLLLARASERDTLSPPAGIGPTLGGFFFKDVVYTFRVAADGLSARMFRSSASGWVSVPLGREMRFTSGGTFVVIDGATITGETSGASAVISRVVLESGSWEAGDAAGRFIFAAQTGTFVAEALKVGANLNVASISGNSSAITLAPGGRFECVIANFTGNAAFERVYGCDGVNRGWEFDGTVFVPISTGMSVDSPKHITVIANHLVFSFGGSFQNSSTAAPYQWVPYLGASEIGIGDEITGFISLPSSDTTPITAILSKNSIHLLYGSSRDDWSMVAYKESGAGALPRTMQIAGERYLLDSRGVSSVSATDAYGNFVFSTLSQSVKSWIDQRAALCVDSCIFRDKNLYCLFFSTGDALFCTVSLNKRGSPAISAFCPVQIHDPVVWIDSREGIDGTERVFFGGASGNVYEFDVGTSFAGSPIQWNFNTHYCHFKSPRTKKRYRGSVTVEMQGDGYAEFYWEYSLSSGSFDVSQPNLEPDVVNLSPTYFDQAYFDESYFDGIPMMQNSFEVCGTGENISVGFNGDSLVSSPLKFSGATILYSLLKEQR